MRGLNGVPRHYSTASLVNHQTTSLCFSFPLDFLTCRYLLLHCQCMILRWYYFWLWKGSFKSGLEWSQILQIFSCRGTRRETNRSSALSPEETRGRTRRTHHFAASLNLMAWHPNSAHCKRTCSVSLSSSPLAFSFFAYLLHFCHIHLLHWYPLTKENF